MLEDLGGETNGALDSEVTVLGSVDEVGADWYQLSSVNGIVFFESGWKE